MPLLTVAIPTYKRAGSLEKLIQTFKAEKNQDFVLLVSDDNSQDDTESMVRKYIGEMPNLVYSRNLENLGYSGNVCKLYELSQTRYVWFLCNDDEVLPGCVDTVLNAIKKYEPTVAVFNYTWIDSFGRKLTAGPDRDIVHRGFSTYFDYAAFMRLTFVSIVLVEKIIEVEDIIKTNYLEEIVNTNYKDNVFFQLSLGLMLLKSRFLFCEISQPILHRNVGFKYGDFFKFILVDSLKAICEVPHAFNNTKFILWSQRQLFTVFQLYLSQKLGLFKYSGRPTKETIKNIWKYYRFYSLFIMFFPVLKFIIPGFLLKSFYFIKLVRIHGFKRGREVFESYVNRVYEDSRETGFTHYR